MTQNECENYPIRKNRKLKHKKRDNANQIPRNYAKNQRKIGVECVRYITDTTPGSGALVLIK